MTSSPVGTRFLVNFNHSLPGVQPSSKYRRGCEARISMPLRTSSAMNNTVRKWLNRSQAGNATEAAARMCCSTLIPPFLR